MHEGDRDTAYRFIASAHEDEPLFIIRGRDALAVPVIMAYVDECSRHRLSGQANRAHDHVDRFVDWQRGNAKLTHLPDPLPARNVVQVCEVCDREQGHGADQCSTGPFTTEERPI